MQMFIYWMTHSVQLMRIPLQSFSMYAADKLLELFHKMVCFLLHVVLRPMFMQECVMTALAEKTVVLVTHQVEFLTETDRILVS